MNKSILAIAIAMAAMTSCSKNQESEAPIVKMMSYNIHNGIGLDKVTDYARIGELIKAQNPDIVAIQEIDSATTRSEGLYVLGEINKTAGMKDYFAPAIDYRGGKYGIGLLCKEEPISVKRMSLPGREEQRALIIAEFEDYVFACTHLSLTEEDRNASIDLISNAAAAYDKPFFIAGDFNAEHDSPFIAEMLKRFVPVTDATGTHLTFPADTPNVQIDYIMKYQSVNGDNTISSIDAQVIDEPVMSDHRPIIVSSQLQAK